VSSRPSREDLERPRFRGGRVDLVKIATHEDYGDAIVRYFARGRDGRGADEAPLACRIAAPRALVAWPGRMTS